MEAATDTKVAEKTENEKGREGEGEGERKCHRQRQTQRSSPRLCTPLYPREKGSRDTRLGIRTNLSALPLKEIRFPTSLFLVIS